MAAHIRKVVEIRVEIRGQTTVYSLNEAYHGG
jgi:hypothetical protein